MISELLEHWASMGCEFAVDGGDVVFDAPADIDLDELAAAIQPRKAAVVAYLQSRSGEATADAGNTATAVIEPPRNDAAIATSDERDGSDAKTITHGVYAAEEDGIALWDDESAVLWTEQNKHCPRCRSAAIWVSIAGTTRCTVCSPPERSRQILETAEQFRRRLGIVSPLAANVLLGAMRGRRHWRPPAATASHQLATRKPR
jgi:hypothetical protein